MKKYLVITMWLYIGSIEANFNPFNKFSYIRSSQPRSFYSLTNSQNEGFSVPKRNNYMTNSNNNYLYNNKITMKTANNVINNENYKDESQFNSQTNKISLDGGKEVNHNYFKQHQSRDNNKNELNKETMTNEARKRFRKGTIKPKVKTCEEMNDECVVYCGRKLAWCFKWKENAIPRGNK